MLAQELHHFVALEDIVALDLKEYTRNVSQISNSLWVCATTAQDLQTQLAHRMYLSNSHTPILTGY